MYACQKISTFQNHGQFYRHAILRVPEYWFLLLLCTCIKVFIFNHNATIHAFAFITALVGWFIDLHPECPINIILMISNFQFNRYCRVERIENNYIFVGIEQIVQPFNSIEGEQIDRCIFILVKCTFVKYKGRVFTFYR